MSRTVLGLDTSCYTTSVALVDEQGRMVQKRRLLSVPQGERGLMQSKGVFQHIQRLPELMEALLKGQKEIAAVAASTRPRPVEGSYMPVFTVSESMGRSLAAALRVPFYATSHQQGHIRAGMANNPMPERFLAVHLSGGTTEVLLVEGEALQITLLGGDADLHAGQMVDRVGVAVGCGFPAGPAMESLAGECVDEGVVLPSSVRGFSVSFSGAESQAQRFLKAGERPERVAKGVLMCIARSLTKLLAYAVKETGIRNVLLVGGVAQNFLIQHELTARLAKMRISVKLRFADKALSGDNAVGVALIGLAALQKEESHECSNH